MRLNLLGRITSRYLHGVTLAIIASVAVGCSSETQRFTDSFSSGATPNQYGAMNGQGGIYEQPVGQTNTIQSSTLPPVASQPNNQPTTQDVPASQVLASQPQALGTIPATGSSNSMNQPLENVKKANTHYIVQSGDTLYAISRKTGVSAETIKRANNLTSGSVRVGQDLTIPHDGNSGLQPTTHEQKVMKTASPQATTSSKPTDIASTSIKPSEPKISPAAAAPNHSNNTNATSTDKLTKSAGSAVVAPQSTGITQMRWPLRGRILSNFGQKEGVKTNEGIDIMAPEGTSVKAAENGVVTYVGDAVKGLGNTILIKHQNNMLTIYGNNSKILVKRGQQVHRGDEIAKSGMSGGAASPRLHFEVRKNQTPVDPIKYLEN